MLDRLLPAPRKHEVQCVDVAAPPAVVWEHVRHGNLGDSPLVRALFALRTLSSRARGDASGGVRIDAMRSTPERPGFQILGDDPPRELTVGAIGKVWQLDIPFVHVDGPEAYAAFAEPGWIKVAWSIRIEPLGDASSRVVLDLRVDATDEASWTKFTRYWVVIGPGSHFIRNTLLAGLRRRFGSPDASDNEEEKALPGDELLPDAAGQMTYGITIRAPAEAVWPWLVQMGCRRGGFYAVDALDNGGVPSAREIHPELQDLAVGDVIPATPDGYDGFEVLAIDPARALILGGLVDVEAGKQLRFSHKRPARYWHITWAFVLERRGESTTRLHVRARVAFPPSGWLHVAWIRPVHALMQTSQLRHLAARAEGRLARDTARDVGAGIGGAAVMSLAWLTPFLRPARSHWGLSAEEASRPRPGDELVPEPRWSWTHAVEVEASPERVWPWIAQIGADRGGFYSYQWLENLVGCDVRNAETVHPEWAHAEGGALVLHPKMPPLHVASLVHGEHLVAFGAPDEAARAEGRPWAAATWAFVVEPLGPGRSRVVSRYRCACSDDVATRLAMGPALLEPVGFAMDRRMLLGIRERAERAEALTSAG